jgi:Predicted Zn-dependent peptidases
MTEEKYNEFVLPNGIRLLHRQKKGEIAHLALMVNTGSRDELESENGLAHCVEHMIFKGTEKRKAYHVLSCLDKVGGDLNAFTTKEETCIQASFLKQFYTRSFDLIADIAFHATFPDNELAKEKDVILDEINSYLDSPSDEIYDVFEDLLFENHPLGRNILGTVDLVKGFTREDILKFVTKNYSTDQMVLGTVGDISFENFKHMAMNYFGNQSRHTVSSVRKPFVPHESKKVVAERNNHLTHCMIGGVAPEYNNSKKLPLILLNNILGGPGMNSRLNLNIREKYGFAYTIESQYNAYSDVGLFSVYMGVDPFALNKAIDLVYKELVRLTKQKLGVMQLYHGKQQLIGQIALGYESGMNELLSVERSLIMGESIGYMPELISKIDALTDNDLLEAANLVFDRDNMNTLIFTGKEE